MLRCTLLAVLVLSGACASAPEETAPQETRRPLVAVTVEACPVTDPTTSADSYAELLPGVVPHRDGHQLFTVTPDGVGLALQASDGAPAWTHPGLRPLASLEEGSLWWRAVDGHSHTAQLVLVDADGQAAATSAPLEFPEWVVVSATGGAEFRLAALAGERRIAWTAARNPLQGVHPGPDADGPASHRASGWLEFQLTPARELSVHSDCPEPAVGREVSARETASVRYWTGRDWETRPFPLGDWIARFAFQREGETEGLFLHRRHPEGDSPIPAVEIATGKRLWTQLIPGQRHLFVHDAGEDPTGRQWQVVDLGSAKTVASLRQPTGLVAGAVLGDRVIALLEDPASVRLGPQPTLRALRAIDMESGNTAWETPVEGRTLFVPPP